MASVKDQFTNKIVDHFFESDTHTSVEHLEIDAINILSGETSSNDIIVVSYKSSPNLSFYDSRGRLIDVDHYLPDNYKDFDFEGAMEIVKSLKNINNKTIRAKRSYAKLLRETFEEGNGNLVFGLRNKFGLEVNEEAMDDFKASIGFEGEQEEFQAKLAKMYPTFFAFLHALVLNQQNKLNGYVHFTNKGNIIITTLDKRSGIAVLIETKNIAGELLPPNKWNIIRTQDKKELEHLLVFRTEDIKQFFDNDGSTQTHKTDRYLINDLSFYLEIDSLVDHTDNLLKIDVLNRCYQTLISDENIIVVLSNENEITIINTHKSVVPHKWPKKVVLPEACEWMQVDENLSLLFAQNQKKEIKVYDITSDHIVEIADLGKFERGFKVNQEGDLIVKPLDRNELVYIKTNANDIISEHSTQSFSKIFADLSYLFKGESVFTKTQFATDITEIPEPKEEVIHSAIEVAQYDFETNIESMLAKAGNDLEELFEIKNKISIARQNITEEITSKASEEGVTFVGQRLRKAISTIVNPSERKVGDMIETLRAEHILAEMQSIDEKIKDLKDPSEYKDILNAVRTYEEELLSMSIDIRGKVITEFKAIQKELNSIFSEQISDDDNALYTFINGEIAQVEKAISEAYDFRQLELLMSTHPAAIELLNMIKQPFILQSFAKNKTFSPAGIQQRLYKALENRKEELLASEKRKKEETQAAKHQLITMVKDSMIHFVNNHSGGFSDLELTSSAAYQQLQKDIIKLERSFGDLRSAIDLRRRLELLILEKNKANLERMVTYEGKYAYVQNDPDLYVDLEHSSRVFATWSMELIEKGEDTYLATFIRDTDLEVYRPTTTDNLRSGRAFEIQGNEYESFFVHYDIYATFDDVEFTGALWSIVNGKSKIKEHPQFEASVLKDNLPDSEVGKKALRCCLEIDLRNYGERSRDRDVPEIGLEFIDETPFFQKKLKEFIIKAKLQLVSGSGVILLTGPPSTGKSAFLKFAAAIMNREYFEHASDKWQTKNSLVTAIKFGEKGPYSVPAGFTKAITTSYSLINIEEIKEWPEALRKSLNPFFAGSKLFIAPDGTKYKIGENILLCAAANLGSMYRQDDEPFTSDFWSRIEVVEYNYAEEEVSKVYLKELKSPPKTNLVTMQDLVRDTFRLYLAPKDPKEKALYISQQLIEFILLPKADEDIKRQNLQNYIQEYFLSETQEPSKNYNPEEAVKVALKRLPDLQGYTALEFFDLYDHFINGSSIQQFKLSKLQVSDPNRYKQLRIIILCLRYMEGCLRKLRKIFYSSAGQTEIEGTNREFIKCVYLLSLIGKLH